jgi:hypothetical protein
MSLALSVEIHATSRNLRAISESEADAEVKIKKILQRHDASVHLVR